MVRAMNGAIQAALASERVVDITTTGRKSGELRRIEIWFHRVDGRYYVTGSPGPRGWYANLLANPRFTFHLKGNTTADLAATAHPVTDAASKRAIFNGIPWIADRVEAEKIPEWISSSPLVEVRFEGA
jgi:deazaflavin-dependent oxidoreductase (nitroreductase family)